MGLRGQGWGGGSGGGEGGEGRRFIYLPPVAFFAFPQSCVLGGQGLPQVVTDFTHLESVLCCCGKSKLTNPKPIQIFGLDFGCWSFDFGPFSSNPFWGGSILDFEYWILEFGFLILYLKCFG